MQVGEVAGAIGKGLLAGAVGTAAMTVSQTIETRVRHRQTSTTPADAAGKVLGVAPIDDAHATRFANFVHWTYGSSWGAVRGLLGSLDSPFATALHLGAVQVTAWLMLPGLDIAPPVTEWGAAELLSEGVHHAVYALASGAAFDYLGRHSSG